jgi:hypothetical protein
VGTKFADLARFQMKTTMCDQRRNAIPIVFLVCTPYLVARHHVQMQFAVAQLIALQQEPSLRSADTMSLGTEHKVARRTDGRADKPDLLE